ncbi:MAG: lysophospholipid acyltransferase family protein [Myxococcota bacterium]|nr:lysophospholipid acyltransferase family protein [Myxococcota bacterium]
MREKVSAPNPALGDALRTFLALLAILPGLIAGLLTWLASGNRRRALNLATRLWGRQGIQAAGIRLRVEGAERLKTRPAIFTLNHQSGIDPILVCALLRENFVAVAKSGIRKNPVLGPAFTFAGTVFVERGSGQEAERALRPAVEACAAGLALAIAPEGTRSAGQAVGRFKKGVVHLALATGVPLIPIVIHNAGNILPRGGFIMRRGEVYVQVLEPIPTEDWTPANLDTEIEALEQRYRDTLNMPEDAAESPHSDN